MPGFRQRAPQSTEVPLNIEAKQIVSPFSAALSCQSNCPFLMKNHTLLLFTVVGRPYANTICVSLGITGMKVLDARRKELSQTIGLFW